MQLHIFIQINFMLEWTLDKIYIFAWKFHRFNPHDTHFIIDTIFEISQIRRPENPQCIAQNLFVFSSLKIFISQCNSLHRTFFAKSGQMNFIFCYASVTIQKILAVKSVKCILKIVSKVKHFVIKQLLWMELIEVSNSIPLGIHATVVCEHISLLHLQLLSLFVHLNALLNRSKNR